MIGDVLIVTKHRDDVFGRLFFSGLPDDLRRHLRLLEFGHDALTPALAEAAAVIVMRHGLFSFGHLAASAARAGVPRYYFLDDNLMRLAEEPDVYGPYWAEYTDDNVRRALRGFDGVLLASRPLLKYFKDRTLHARLFEYPPIAWPVLRARENGWSGSAGEPFRIAFFGGELRRDVFIQCVYPAVLRLAADTAVELVLAGIDPAGIPAPAGRLRLAHLPYDVRYGHALAALADRRPDVLAHPTLPSNNNQYKNANVLINARSAGAVAVLSNIPPYDTLGTPAPALLCDNTPDAWFDAFARLARNPDLCARTFENTSRYCDAHFSGRENAEVIRRILDAHPAPGPASRAFRRVIAGPALGADRAVVRMKDLARRSAFMRAAARRLGHGAA
jgi:glycosyltransferase involved in cell wall biosynthesis